MRRAGADVRVAAARAPRELRTYALTDLVWARAARAAATAGIAEHAPRAVLYHTVTAALLWPRPGAIRFDAPAAANRPGRHGVWQRPLERRRLAAAPLLVPVDPGTLAETPRPHAEAVVVPIPVAPSAGPAQAPAPAPASAAAAPAPAPATASAAAQAAAPAPAAASASAAAQAPALAPAARDIAALTYAANPHKKGLDRVLRAWSRARRDDEELVVAGSDEPIDAPGVRVVGRLDPQAYRALLRRARVFVCAPRREDYGIAQLEALADGCVLVTTTAPGPYAALPLARELDPRLVVEHPGALAPALRLALDTPVAGYAQRAAAALVPFSRASVDAVVRDELLPRLLR
ncbi:MAG: hypothetical protein QOJ35_979 [Solirubrobacteraceae bacterium]|nr:hypothetical protein [Solirubrobacteraceae bacterium]